MKQNKLVEMVNDVNSFSDVWDSTQAIYNKNAKGDNFTANDFEFTFKPNEVVCSVLKVTKKTHNKEAKYTKNLSFKETGVTVEEAFKKAALRLFS